jgi:hypothetical protein
LDEEALGEEMMHTGVQEEVEYPEEQKSTHVLCARALLGLAENKKWVLRVACALVNDVVPKTSLISVV